MTHLDPDELIDAIERMLAPDRQAHLATCEQCQGQVAGLSSVLADATLVSVPEPSPLFWTHFSERVRTAIDDDVAPGDNWPSWLRWQVLLPLGAVAMIILALMISVPKQDAEAPQVASEEAAPAIDDSWPMVAALVGDLNFETAAQAGVLVTPGVAERAVLELDAEERQELTRLLKAELTRTKS